MKLRPLSFIVTLFVTGSIIGCGYTTRPFVVKEKKNVFIAPFKNSIAFTSEDAEYRKLRSYFPLLEVTITNAVIDKFISDGNYRVTREEDADLILKGELLDYQRDALRYDDNDNVLEYRINLVVKLSLWNTKDAKEEWKESSFIGDTTYFTSGTLAKSENTAIKDAVTDLAKRVVERTVENW